MASLRMARLPAGRRRGARWLIASAALMSLVAGPLGAQSIAVVATPSFRPTAVLGPHVRYVVGTDSADGSVILRDLAIPPVLFAGTVRIEGVQPGTRTPESAPFADTVRFDPDGRVQLLLADQAGRPPMTAEVIGARGAAAARLVIVAPRLPPGRVLLVTMAPADIADLAGRRVGFGVRDRLRVDDRNGMAYLADTSAGSVSVAIGLGRGVQGRIQADVATVVRSRDFGGEQGRERRQVGALVFVLDPVRDDSGTARAEIVFGVGDTEAEAAAAARAASAEPSGTPPAAALRLRTPSSEVELLSRHLLAAAGWMLDWDVLGGERVLPASASRPAVRAVDAWNAAGLALQRRDAAAVCGSYRLLERASAGAPATRVEVGPRLGPSGRYLGASDSTDGSADAALVLLAYGCYAATRDSALLQRSWPSLAAAASRAAQGGPAALTADAVARLAELGDELARLRGDGRPAGDSLRAEARRLAPPTGAGDAASWWRTATVEARRGISRDYGRLSAGGEEGGLSLGAAGAWLDLVVGEVFGVTEYLDRVEVAPRLAEGTDEALWQLTGWRLASGDTLNLAYRPADRAAAIRITASRRTRVVVRLPWLAPSSCVTARRGPDAPERLTLVAQADGSYYVDIRGAYEPADVRFSAGACPG